MFSRHKSKNNKNLVVTKNAPKDLASRVIREASWFTLLFVGLYITLALASYSENDPSFSHSIEISKNITNLAGISGAYFSDLFLNIMPSSEYFILDFKNLILSSGQKLILSEIIFIFFKTLYL